MQFARRSELLRPSGRLLEPRSDSGPRGMIIALPSENPDANQDSQTRGGQNPAYRLTRYYLFCFHCTLSLISGGCAKTVQFARSFSIPSELSMIRRVRSRSSFTY